MAECGLQVLTRTFPGAPNRLWNTYIYIYTEREREGERERDIPVCVCAYMCTYIYMYILCMYKPPVSLKGSEVRRAPILKVVYNSVITGL